MVWAAGAVSARKSSIFRDEPLPVCPRHPAALPTCPASLGKCRSPVGVVASLDICRNLGCTSPGLDFCFEWPPGSDNVRSLACEAGLQRGDRAEGLDWATLSSPVSPFLIHSSPPRAQQCLARCWHRMLLSNLSPANLMPGAWQLALGC